VMRLETKGLGVERGGRRILSNVSLELAAGQILGLVGPNGSGKSTLLRCMAGLWQPSQGGVACNGRDLRNMQRREVARHITYVPQETTLSFDFSVLQTVLMGRYSHRGRFERETREDIAAAEDALRRADVLHLADRSVTALSGGERQRVLIARSLATRAPILLLDEPTANLDVNHALDILELCRSLSREGSSVAIATHDLNSIHHFADQVALMETGRISAIGVPETVLTTENLKRVFQVSSEALRGSDGTRTLVFHRLTRDVEVRHQ
jgi:iron complex transport system ATP-binding protein